VIRLPDVAVALLRCPVCRARLNIAAEELRCTNQSCGSSFPVIDGISILINNRTSIFSIEDFVSHRTTTLATGKPNALKAFLKSTLGVKGFDRLKRIYHRVMPSIDKNITGENNYTRLAELLSTAPGAPLVLVLGGGVLGQGIAALMRNTRIQLVESDVSFGPRTGIILDAHDIPFEDETFDAVIAQAVLEHVADPYRCVEEIHRVLKKDGVIYAETPFMQQVHAGRYDFTRFSHLGHRRLFRRFDEIDSGIVCGPGMALAWSYQYFLTSFVTSPTLRSAARTFARFTSFYLKYFDPFLAGKHGAYDAASGFYLLGRKGERTLSDRELIKLYRGLDSL
jgi:SAM-dependent methyltransferase/uncharacterized protein YbaR (Trm112 family)